MKQRNPRQSRKRNHARYALVTDLEAALAQIGLQPNVRLEPSTQVQEKEGLRPIPLQLDYDSLTVRVLAVRTTSNLIILQQKAFAKSFDQIPRLIAWITAKWFPAQAKVDHFNAQTLAQVESNQAYVRELAEQFPDARLRVVAGVQTFTVEVTQPVTQAQLKRIFEALDSY